MLFVKVLIIPPTNSSTCIVSMLRILVLGLNTFRLHLVRLFGTRVLNMVIGAAHRTNRPIAVDSRLITEAYPSLVLSLLDVLCQRSTLTTVAASMTNSMSVVTVEGIPGYLHSAIMIYQRNVIML